MAGHPRAIRAVTCPDCGEVEVRADVFDGDRGVSGKCPECGDRLYFDNCPHAYDEADKRD